MPMGLTLVGGVRDNGPEHSSTGADPGFVVSRMSRLPLETTDHKEIKISDPVWNRTIRFEGGYSTTATNSFIVNKENCLNIRVRYE